MQLTRASVAARPCARNVVPSVLTPRQVFGQARRGLHPARTVVRAEGQPTSLSTTTDISKLVDIMSARNSDGDQAAALEQISKALDVPIATVRNMAFKRKGLTSLTGAEVTAKVSTVASIVDVPLEKARQMCIIQPGLLTETERNAETLASALKLICYDLKAPKAEIIDLIINNPSILHGREMRLSVAEVANLAMLREPKSRVVD